MTEITCVLSTVRYQGEHLERLRAAFAPAEFVHVGPKDETAIAKALTRADVAVLASDLDERFLHAPRLKWVHCDHAGLNKSARPDVFDSGLLVTGSAGRSAPVLAEHAIMLMLALAFDFPRFNQAQRDHQWGIPGQDELRGLFGRTAGILGMGHTGQDLAVRLKALGMTVLGYRRRRSDALPGVDHLYSADAGDTIDPLLEQSDYVILALTLSDATYRLIGERELHRMKSSARLVNMARGAVVDQDALIRALREGWIAGAGVDTTDPEPLPASSDLWDAPNLLLTPHVTPQVPDRTGRSLDIICENIRRYREDQPLLNQLTRADVFTKG